MVERGDGGIPDSVWEERVRLNTQRHQIYSQFKSFASRHREPLERLAFLDWFTVVHADSRRMTLSAKRHSARLEGKYKVKPTLAQLHSAEKNLVIAKRRVRKKVAARQALIENPKSDRYLRTMTYLTENFYPAAYAAEDAVMRSHGMRRDFTEVEIDASIKENIVAEVVSLDKTVKMKRRTRAFPKRKVVFRP
jgi:hypothetical protein